MEPRYVSIILFVGKVWDAVTDPIIGILVERTNTRWGKMRPWIIMAAPFACASYFLQFYLPWDVVNEPGGGERVDTSNMSKLGFYFTVYCLFQGLLSCLHVPYTALTMYVATIQKDRDSITAIRMWFEAFGMLVGVMIQGMFVSGTRCNGDEEPDYNKTITSERDAYMHGSIGVIAIYIVCCIITFFGSTEKKGIIQDKKENQTGFFQGLKSVLTFKPFMWASLTFFLFSVSIQTVQGNLALYCTHTLKSGQDISYHILVLIVVVIITMPLWNIIAVRYGKKRAYAAGIVDLLVTFMSLLFLPADMKWLYYVEMAIAGLGISVAFLLPWSVIPDVLDLYMLENKTRHDALFYSLYVFFNKLGVGLATAISHLALEFGGYVTGECNQPKEVELTLRLLISPGPSVMMILASISLYMYPINQNVRRSIHQRMKELGKGSNQSLEPN